LAVLGYFVGNHKQATYDLILKVDSGNAAGWQPIFIIMLFYVFIKTKYQYQNDFLQKIS